MPDPTPQNQLIIDAQDRTKGAVQAVTRGVGRLRNVITAENKAMLAEQKKFNKQLEQLAKDTAAITSALEQRAHMAKMQRASAEARAITAAENRKVKAIEKAAKEALKAQEKAAKDEERLQEKVRKNTEKSFRDRAAADAKARKEEEKLLKQMVKAEQDALKQREQEKRKSELLAARTKKEEEKVLKDLAREQNKINKATAAEAAKVAKEQEKAAKAKLAEEKKAAKEKEAFLKKDAAFEERLIKEVAQAHAKAEKEKAHAAMAARKEQLAKERQHAENMAHIWKTNAHTFKSIGMGMRQAAIMGMGGFRGLPGNVISGMGQAGVTGRFGGGFMAGGGGGFGGGGSGLGSLAGALVGAPGGALGGLISGVGQAIPGVGGIVSAAGAAVTAVSGLAGVIANTLVASLEKAAVWGAKAFGGIIRFATEGTIELGKLGVELNATRQQLIFSLTALGKNEDQATDLYNKMSLFADLTPFDDFETIEAGKQLETFGFTTDKVAKKIANMKIQGVDAKTLLLQVGNVAYAMGRPMEQVVRMLGAAQAGIFRAQQFAPLGISRMTLQGQGIKFDDMGRIQNRHKLLEATLRIFEERFGGMMERSADKHGQLITTMISHWKRLDTFINENLFKGVDAALGNVGKVVGNVLGIPNIKDPREALNTSISVSPKEFAPLVNMLRVPFDMAGRGIEYLSKQFEGLVKWLNKVADWQAVENFFIDLVTTVKTLGEQILKLLGIDLSKIGKSLNISDILKTISEWINKAAAGFLTLVSVGKEAFLLLKESVVDFKDYVLDNFTDMAIKASNIFSHMLANAVDAIALVPRALSKLPFVGKKFTGVADELNKNAADMRLGANAQLASHNLSQAVVRGMREDEKDREFQRLHGRPRSGPGSMSPFEAFMKLFRETSGKFNAAFNANRPAVAGALGANLNELAPAHDTPFGPIVDKLPPGARLMSGPGAASAALMARYNPGVGALTYGQQAMGMTLPGSPADIADRAKSFFNNLEALSAWVKGLKSGVDAGVVHPADLIDAQRAYVDALKRNAESLMRQADSEDVTEEARQKATGEYLDALNDLTEMTRKGAENARKYLATRSAVVGGFFDLLPDAQASREKQKFLPAILRNQRNRLVGDIFSEKDPQRQQDLLKELIGVGGEFEELFDKKKDPFKGRFRTKGSSAQDFILGSGPQAEMLRNLIMNGSPGQERVLDPMNRTANASERSAALLQGIMSLMMPGAFRSDGSGVPLPGLGTVLGLPAAAQAENYQNTQQALAGGAKPTNSQGPTYNNATGNGQVNTYNSTFNVVTNDPEKMKQFLDSYFKQMQWGAGVVPTIQRR